MAFNEDQVALAKERGQMAIILSIRRRGKIHGREWPRNDRRGNRLPLTMPVRVLARRIQFVGGGGALNRPNSETATGEFGQEFDDEAGLT